MGQKINPRLSSRRTGLEPRGQVLAMVAVALVALLGMAAIAVDVGELWRTKRLMQTAADAAAIAGVDALLQGAGGSVSAAAQNAAAQNGFTNGSPSTSSPDPVSVIVNNPPASGTFQGNSNAVQAIVYQAQPTYFMRAVGVTTVTVAAAAVAAINAGQSCIYTLDSSKSGTLKIAGNATFSSACGVYDNSGSSSGLIVDGGGTLDAPFAGVVGGASINGGASTPPVSGIAAFGDPLASVEPPPVGTCNSYKTLIISTSTTLNPGEYCGGITLLAGASVTFNAGTYVIDGGGLTISGGASASGDGVTFYLTGQSGGGGGPKNYGGVDIASSSNVDFSAPTSGSLEAMLFFQDRSITNGQKSVINGGANCILDGALYFPTTELDYSGTSGSDGYTYIVADTLNITGTAYVGDNYSSLSGGSLFKIASLVQ